MGTQAQPNVSPTAGGHLEDNILNQSLSSSSLSAYTRWMYPLPISIRLKNLGIVKYLINKGAYIDVWGYNFATPLYIACSVCGPSWLEDEHPDLLATQRPSDMSQPSMRQPTLKNKDFQNFSSAREEARHTTFVSKLNVETKHRQHIFRDASDPVTGKLLKQTHFSDTGFESQAVLSQADSQSENSDSKAATLHSQPALSLVESQTRVCLPTPYAPSFQQTEDRSVFSDSSVPVSQELSLSNPDALTLEDKEDVGKREDLGDLSTTGYASNQGGMNASDIIVTRALTFGSYINEQQSGIEEFNLQRFGSGVPCACPCHQHRGMPKKKIFSTNIMYKVYTMFLEYSVLYILYLRENIVYVKNMCLFICVIHFRFIKRLS